MLGPHIAPFRWLVSKDCFDPPRDDRFFVAVSRADAKQIDRNALVAQAGRPDETVGTGEYEIWIYTTAKSDLAWLQR